jgi:hypothetical protein
MKRSYIGYDVQKRYVSNFGKTIRREVRSALHLIETSNSRKFESDIRNRRLIKLPRMLLRSMGKPAVSDMHFTIVTQRPLSSDAPHYRIAAEDIDLVMRNGVSRKKLRLLEKRAAKSLSKPPLSKYGIETCVRAITIAELKPILKTEKRPMWIYKTKNLSHQGKANPGDLLSRPDSLRKGIESA